MTLRQLATFLELSRSGSVRVAAERLFVTQPAVSAVIASLQRELGVELVAREGRGLRLTPSGMVLAEYARRIQGTLDEAAVATAGEHILPAAIAGFRSSHPATEVSVEVANREHVWERLAAHEVDLVVGGRPPDQRGLQTRALRPYELVIVAAPDAAPPPRPRALAGSTWLLRENRSGTRATVEQYLAEQGISRSTLTLVSNGAVREAVAVGLGITLIARDAVAAELASGRLVEVEAPGVPMRRDWHVVTRDDGQLPGAGSLFFAHLVPPSGCVLATS